MIKFMKVLGQLLTIKEELHYGFYSKIEVFKVTNTQYDSSHLDAISPLVKNLIAMDEVQTEKFYDEVIKQSSVPNNNEDEFNKLKQHMFNKKNKKEAVLEYIKTGTITLAFANTLLTIAKTLLGLV